MLDLSRETEALARRLAADQHMSVDDTVRGALEQHARSLSEERNLDAEPVSNEEVARRRAVIRGFQDRFAALPSVDPRPVREIADEISDL